MQATRAIHELLLESRQRMEVQSSFASLFVALLLRTSFLVAAGGAEPVWDQQHSAESMDPMRYRLPGRLARDQGHPLSTTLNSALGFPAPIRPRPEPVPHTSFHWLTPACQPEVHAKVREDNGSLDSPLPACWLPASPRRRHSLGAASLKCQPAPPGAVPPPADPRGGGGRQMGGPGWRRLPPFSALPSSTVDALKALMRSAGYGDHVSHVQKLGGWELLASLERHHEGVALLAR